MGNDSFIQQCGAHLQIISNQSETPLSLVFVGQREQEYIVLAPSLPPQVNYENIFNEGDSVSIKVLSEDTVIEYGSQFIKIVHDPVKLLLFEFPQSIASKRHRSHKRINCFISAEIEINYNNSALTMKGLITDISKKGCRILLKNSKGGEWFHNDKEILLRCDFPGIAGTQEASGKVSNIYQKHKDIIIGIEFSNPIWWVPPYR